MLACEVLVAAATGFGGFVACASPGGEKQRYLSEGFFGEPSRASQNLSDPLRSKPLFLEWRWTAHCQ